MKPADSLENNDFPSPMSTWYPGDDGEQNLQHLG